MGLVNGDTLSGALATSAKLTSNVGSYGITQGSVAASGNYALTYVGANLAVTQRAITVAADAQSRLYGNANPALTYQVGGSGLVNGDTLLGTLATSATTTSNAGTYAITQGTLAASSNYAFSYVGANLVISAPSTPPAPPAPPAPIPPETLRKAAEAKALGSDVGALSTWRDRPQQLNPVVEPARIDQRSPQIICKLRHCEEVVYPDNREVGPWIRFVDTTAGRNPRH